MAAFEPRERSFRRLAGRVAPASVAAAGIIFVALRTFPTDVAGGTFVIALFGAGYAATLIKRPVPLSPNGKVEPLPPQTIDPESGLPNHLQLRDLLRRELARSRRYGDRSTLALFEVQVTGFRPREAGESPPSPGRFIADTLRSAVRESDAVMRLDQTRFAVFLTECDREGARQLMERTRTGLATTPYARNDDGSGVYVRAWAAAAPSAVEFASPEEYVRAALAELERTRPRYEAAQNWYTGAA